jgi:hypothetical protein
MKTALIIATLLLLPASVCDAAVTVDLNPLPNVGDKYAGPPIPGYQNVPWKYSSIGAIRFEGGGLGTWESLGTFGGWNPNPPVGNHWNGVDKTANTAYRWSPTEDGMVMLRQRLIGIETACMTEVQAKVTACGFAGIDPATWDISSCTVDCRCNEEREEKINECGGSVNDVDWTGYNYETCEGNCRDCDDNDEDGACATVDPDDNNPEVNGDLRLVVSTFYEGSAVHQMWCLKTSTGFDNSVCKEAYASGWSAEYLNSMQESRPGDFTSEACLGANCSTLTGPRCQPYPNCDSTIPGEDPGDLPPVDKPPPPSCNNAEAECAAMCQENGGVAYQECTNSVAICRCVNGKKTEKTTDQEGNEVLTEKTDDGLTKTTTTRPDGTQSIVYSNDAGTKTGTVEVAADKSGAGVHYNPDGSRTEETVYPDGTKKTITYHNDGSITEVIDHTKTHDGLSSVPGNTATSSTGGSGGSDTVGNPSTTTIAGGGGTGTGSGTGTGNTGSGNSVATGGGDQTKVTTNTDSNGTITKTVESGKDLSATGETDSSTTGSATSTAGTGSGSGGGGGTQPSYSQERQFDWSPLLSATDDLSGKFPLSLFGDIRQEINRFQGTGSAPKLTISLMGNQTDIDLAIFDPIASVIRTLIAIAMTLACCWLMLRLFNAVR